MARTILIPVDYSGSAQRALRVGVATARGDSARLIVLHVLPGAPPQSDPANVWEKAGEARQRERERLAAWLENVLGAAPEATLVVEWGEVVERITAVAAEHGADLIFVGARGASRIPGQVLGAVARQLVASAPCPVGVLHDRGAPVSEQEAGTAATVGSVVLRPPVTISQDATLAAAAELMERESIHQLPVVEDGCLIGILSTRDLQAHLGYLEHTKVDAAMTRGPVVFQASDPAQKAARVLLERNFNALPVLEGNRLVGVVSKTDLLRLLVRMLDEPSAA